MINPTEQTQTSESMIVRLVRTSDDLRSVAFGDYERVVVAVRDKKKVVDSNDVAARLFQQKVEGYQIVISETSGIKELGVSSQPYVEVRRNNYQPAISQTPVQRKPSCEMPRFAKGMSVEEITEICAQLPPGVGEEEYLARMDELGDAI